MTGSLGDERLMTIARVKSMAITAALARPRGTFYLAVYTTQYHDPLKVSC